MFWQVHIAILLLQLLSTLFPMICTLLCLQDMIAAPLFGLPALHRGRMHSILTDKETLEFQA